MTDQLKSSHAAYKLIWNAAIEAAAAKAHQTTYNAVEDKFDKFTVQEIRKLLK
jgi:hypothetical protein